MEDLNKDLWGNQNTSLHLASFLGEAEVCATMIEKGSPVIYQIRSKPEYEKLLWNNGSRCSGG